MFPSREARGRCSRSGVHQPKSSLWFKTGDFKVGAEEVSILDVLPTLLEYYGVEAADEEAMRRRGKSILPLLDIGPYNQPAAAAASAPVHEPAE